jgi:hypothetical protein
MNILVTNTRNSQAYTIIRALRPYANKIIATMEGENHFSAWFSHAARSRLVGKRYFTTSPAADEIAKRLMAQGSHNGAGLLQVFAEDLSKPLRSRDDPTDYVPSQKLAALIKSANVHGIRYPSAMAPNGTNLVIFDPSLVRIGTSHLVEIVETKVEYRHVENG